MEFYTNVTATSAASSLTWPLTTTYAQPLAIGAAWPAPEAAAPVRQSPLDWLDAEVERTCALARNVR